MLELHCWMGAYTMGRSSPKLFLFSLPPLCCLWCSHLTAPYCSVVTTQDRVRIYATCCVGLTGQDEVVGLGHCRIRKKVKKKQATLCNKIYGIFLRLFFWPSWILRQEKEGTFQFFLSLLQCINLLWTQSIRWTGSTPKRHYYHPVQKCSTYGHHQNPNWLYVPHF